MKKSAPFVCYFTWLFLAICSPLASSDPTTRKREPIPAEYLDMATDVVSSMEGAVQRFVNGEPTENFERTVREARFKTNASFFPQECGYELLKLGERQAQMASGESASPMFVLAVFAPRSSEGVADFMKQAALVAGVASSMQV
jgi:hypothetical protein